MLKSRRIRSCFMHVRSILEEEGLASPIFLKDIDGMIRLISEKKSSTSKKVKSILEDELGLAYLHLVAIAFLIAAFNKKVPVPESHSRSRLIVESFLTQLTNYSLATLQLIENGQDNAARALVRPTIELSWQMLICLARDDYVDLWLQGDNPEEARKVWDRLFRGKINRLLVDIEQSLGTPSDISDQLKVMRLDTQRFYSQAVHHSAASILFGSMHFNMDDPEMSDDTVIFGSATDSLRTPLSALNTMFLYFNCMFPRILTQIANYPVPSENLHWKAGSRILLVAAIAYSKVYQE